MLNSIKKNFRISRRNNKIFIIPKPQSQRETRNSFCCSCMYYDKTGLDLGSTKDFTNTIKTLHSISKADIYLVVLSSNISGRIIPKIKKNRYQHWNMPMWCQGVCPTFQDMPFFKWIASKDKTVASVENSSSCDCGETSCVCCRGNY